MKRVSSIYDWEGALRSSNLVELERLVREPLFLDDQIVKRLLLACHSTWILCAFTEYLPKEWLDDRMYQGWTPLHQLTEICDDFDTAVALVKMLPREHLAMTAYISEYRLTCCELAFVHGRYAVGNALLALGGLARWNKPWDAPYNIILFDVTSMAYMRATRAQEAQRKARKAALIVYGILRLRLKRIPRDMAKNCAEEVYATRCFKKWTE